MDDNLKQRLIDHGGVLHENTRDLKEAERTDVFMTSRPVYKDTDVVPVILRAYLKRHGTVAKNLLLLTINQQRLPVVEPENQYEIQYLGANVWTILSHFGFMQKPDVPRILQEANAHPELRHLDLSLANLEIGEEELMVDPETPWFRKLWVRVFVLQLKLSVPAHRYFGLRWDHPTCSFPIVLNKPFDFGAFLVAGVGLDDNPATFPDPYSYSGSADFYNTATLTDILVTDDTGNPIPGISIEADSQTGYPLSPLNQVPEPQSLVLLATGLVGLLGYGWRKKRQAA